MEHANKALLMAGGMLFAILVMSLVAYVFGRLASIPNEEDARVKAKQVAAFNNEYSAYDKKIMYGVDVISVLNKALSNNNKYINEDAHSFIGGGYNTDYVIDIEVILKRELTESVSIYYVQNTAGNRVTELEYGPGAGPKKGAGYYPMKKSLPSDPQIFDVPPADYQSMIYNPGENPWNKNFVVNKGIPTKVKQGTYHLLGADGSNPDPINDSVSTKTAQLKADNTLKELLKYSTVIIQPRKNLDNNTFAPDGWSQAIWKPAIYDLKTRKFKCLGDKTVTNEETGRIVKMIFEEI